jgi:hypothetical protein
MTKSRSRLGPVAALVGHACAAPADRCGFAPPVAVFWRVRRFCGGEPGQHWSAGGGRRRSPLRGCPAGCRWRGPGCGRLTRPRAALAAHMPGHPSRPGNPTSSGERTARTSPPRVGLPAKPWPTFRHGPVPPAFRWPTGPRPTYRTPPWSRGRTAAACMSRARTAPTPAAAGTDRPNDRTAWSAGSFPGRVTIAPAVSVRRAWSYRELSRNHR